MTHEPYEPGTTLRTAVGGGDPGGRTGRSSSSRTVGSVVGGLGAVAALVVGLAAAAQDDGGQPEPDRYGSCAAEHDETSSLFSDAEWCDLELNGGDGDGVPQEPYGFDDGYGATFP